MKTQKHGAMPGIVAPKNTRNTEATALALVDAKDGPRIDSRVMAQSMDNTHRATVALIDKYRGSFERFGQVLFKKTVGERKQGGGNAERVALLNEDQALFLLALSRNTERVVEMKFKLVQAFSEARRNAQQRKEEYLPGHHLMHDTIQEKCSGSGNAGRVHMNFEKLINRTVGIESGQRSRAPVAALTIAQQVTVAALAGAVDHHDGYQRAKAALGTLQSLLQAPGVTHGT